VWWAAQWGVTGVAWMNLVVTFGVVVPMYLILVRPMIGGRIHHVFLTSGVPAAAGVIAGAGAVVVSRWPSDAWAALVAGAIVGGLIYLALTLRWARSALARARRLRDMAAWQGAA
jgi:hypothetical protein